MQRLVATRTKHSSIWPLCRSTSQTWIAQFRKLSSKPLEININRGELERVILQTRVQEVLTGMAQRLDEDDVLEHVSGGEEEPLSREKGQGGGFYLGSLCDLGRYRLLLKIGFGRTSSVWLARDSLGGFVAIKILSASQTELNDIGMWQELEAHTRIAGKAKEARKSNCITLLDSFRILALKGSNDVHLCLVFPLMRANLNDVINPRGGPAPTIPMKVTKKVLRSVLKALKFLHQNNTAHREITARDVMITMDPWVNVARWAYKKNSELRTRVARSEKQRWMLGLHRSIYLPKPTMDELASENTEFVLSDLGTARFVDQPPLVNAYTPLSLRPPETLLGGKWDQSVDIWNFGTMAYYLLTRKPLFSLSPTGTHGPPPPLRPPEPKKSFEAHQAIPGSAEWLLYQMSSICCGSDLHVGSFPKRLLENWSNSDPAESELKMTHDFGGTGRVDAAAVYHLITYRHISPLSPTSAHWPPPDNPSATDSERKRARFFDEQGRLKAFTSPPQGPHNNNYAGLKRRSFLDLLKDTPVPMALEEREDAASFLGRCVRLDPKGRASAAELLEHRFLKV